MTVLPEPVSFTAPEPGLWMRNFRLGEWLPEAVTPLFGTWLLPELEAGYLDGMHSCIGVRVPFRWALVHDWYYTATPIPSPRLLALVITRGRSRAIKTLWHALIRVGRDPVAADRAVLSDLYRRWRDEQLPRYREVVAQAQSELPAASPARVTQLVTAIAREAGQVAVTAKHRQLAADRQAAQAACRAALAPGRQAEFDLLLEVAQRYAAIREEQSRDLTLGWPVLRACASRLGEHLAERQALAAADDVHFCTLAEVNAAVTGQARPLANAAADRRGTWEQHRRLLAPVTIGQPPRLVGDVIDKAVRAARTGQAAEGAIVGHPASAGRATGPVHIIREPQDFESFADGEVLVAKATAPAWTPLFARAAAVVTDGGTLAAHASLVAREYGIPAVVGTSDATRRLHNGQIVTVDGNAGTVIPAAVVERADA
jgi:pyruvate,water dikinase